MAHDVTLYMFNGSAPSQTARLMLEHKGIDHRCKHLTVGPHAFAMVPRGFEMMTVSHEDRRPAGSGLARIARALDELQSQPPLFSADARARKEVVEAERRGEELQDVARRIVLFAARRDPSVFTDVYGDVKALMRPLQRLTRGLVIKLASAGHHASRFAVEEDLAGLPARLDQVDAWIQDGVLAGRALNAADFQIAPNIALLLRFDDLAPHIESRPAAQLARRLVAEQPARIAPVLPREWLAPLAPDG